MSPFVIIIILISALLNAGWNLATKRVAGNFYVVWLAQGIICVLFCPPALYYLFQDVPSLHSFLLMIATGILQAFYFLVLAKAYQEDDISLVYPLARGTSVAGSAISGYAVFGETMATYGITGVLAVVVGAMLLGLDLSKNKLRGKGFFLAIIVGFLLVSTNSIDKAVVQKVPPIFCLWFGFVVTTICLAPYMIIWKMRQCREAWMKYKAYSAIIGIGAFMGYVMVLFAFRQAHLGYIVALRELSIVFGCLAGVIFLHEKISLQRLIGIVTIVGGNLLINLL